MFISTLVYLLILDGVECGRGRVVNTRPFRQVRITQGVARGYFVSGPPHYAFLGLPYARAPTSLHRFKAPEPPPSWDGIFEATHRIKCAQDGVGDENCLVVNVFTPPNGTERPVCVFVHDGDFQNGWGAYHPPASLLTQGLIIVTFNYRLGMLGFLCLGVPEAPGNAGLKDQVSALYWVQRNIANFGGSPTDVTVYGTESGAIAIHLLLLSGLTEGLFHKAVLASGSALSPYSITYEPTSLALNAAVNLGYEGTENGTELAEFLINLPAKQLTNISEIYLPCIENYEYDESLLEWDPMEVLKKGSSQQVPILMMYSSKDGSSIIEKNIENFSDPPENYDDLLPNNLVFNDETMRIKIAKYVKDFYFDDNEEIIENYENYFNHVLYEYPIIKSAVLYAEQIDVPIFVLKILTNADTDNMQINNYFESIMFTPDHIFNEKYAEDSEEINTLVTLLCNFIKLGDPTPIITTEVPIIWQSLQEVTGELKVQQAPILVLDTTVSMSTAGTNQRLAFWDQVYENFYRSHSPIHEKLD